jgi:glycosyltransferase involved in cell wall biosynthesis
VVLEAFASGRAVLGTALGGIPYLIGEGSAEPAGWVAPARADALAAALPAARDGAGALGPVARARYERMFHPDVVIRRLLEVYDETAARPIG